MTLQEMISSGDIDGLMTAINDANIKLETRPFDNSEQDTYGHQEVNGPATYRGRPYSPLAFGYQIFQLEQAEAILRKAGMI